LKGWQLANRAKKKNINNEGNGGTGENKDGYIKGKKRGNINEKKKKKNLLYYFF